jgi:hypothetical protein
MAQIVQVREVCDVLKPADPRLPTPHPEGGKGVPGETVVFGLDGQWYAAELCESHDRKTLETIRALVSVARPLGSKDESLMAQAKSVDTASVHKLPATRPALTSVTPAQAAKALAPTPATVARAVAKSNGKAKRSGPTTTKERRHWCLWCDVEPYTSTTAMLLHLQTKHDVPVEQANMVDMFGLQCPLCGSYADSGKLGVHLMHKHSGLSVTEAFKMALAKGESDKHGVAARVFAKIPAA